MTLKLAHLSDLHFGNPKGHLRRTHLEQILGTIFKDLSTDSYLVISGDITFQGQPIGYTEALEAFKLAIEQAGFSEKRIILCPGNHDLVKESAGRPNFTTFDEWSSSVRNDKACTFANRSVRHICHEIADFLILNSAYHGNHTYGMIDRPTLLEEIRGLEQKSPARKRPRIAVLHHHLIPVLENDVSVTRNAYGLIETLQNSGFTLILHGHQHAMLQLILGKERLQIFGTGSFGYNTPGYINTVSTFTFGGAGDVVAARYGISLDTPAGIVKLESLAGN